MKRARQIGEQDRQADRPGGAKATFFAAQDDAFDPKVTLSARKSTLSALKVTQSGPG